MAVNLLMPALSPTMETGTLAKWLVKEGDSVEAGDLLAEIETDKAVMEFEAVDDGTIAQILVAEGTENVAVNTPIALLAIDGDDLSSVPESADDTASRELPEPPPATGTPPPSSSVSETLPGLVAPGLGQPTFARTNGSRLGSGTGRILASPLARRMAANLGFDLSSIAGTGPRGRIVKRDIEGHQAASAGKPAAPAPAPISLASRPDIVAVYADRPHREVALDGMRKVVAARLTEAKQTIPHFYLRKSVRIDRLLEVRSDANASLESRGVRLSVNDFIIRAAALALQDVPACNAIWAGDRILQFDASDVAVAVAVEGGLFTPVIRDCETRDLPDISAAMKDLAARARKRRLLPDEYQGGSFAISNLGMYGIESFDAVINPPHASILAVGAGRRTPVAQDGGGLTTASVMDMSLSVDHRVIDGALGAEFLGAISERLERPAGLLL
ncbi:MAG: pyruvate dehydrogenase complex dihydrolipoamide acetyltransferase [Paracoccaceae bacterium]|nr:pyruvate dehydrogenase complex dihydrolipoamide acetyltransferase [Paracoccaceae bacterium]